MGEKLQSAARYHFFSHVQCDGPSRREPGAGTMSTTSPARGASSRARANVARPGESGRARQSRRERVLLVHATLLHSLASVAPRRTLTQATRAAVDTRTRARVWELEGREHSRTATRGCRARRIHEPAPLRAALGRCAGGRAKSAQQRWVRRLRARASEREGEGESARVRGHRRASAAGSGGQARRCCAQTPAHATGLRWRAPSHSPPPQRRRPPWHVSRRARMPERLARRHRRRSASPRPAGGVACEGGVLIGARRFCRARARARAFT